MRPWLVVTAALLLGGCAARPRWGEDDTGRPAITWREQAHTVGVSPQAAGTPTKEGRGALERADALYREGIRRRAAGDLTGAADLYRQALAIREREEGPEHPDVAATLNNLAAVYGAQGSYAEAQPLLERALAIREKTLGAEHVLTAQSLNNLALLYAAEGRADAAEPLYRRAIAILEKDPGAAADLRRTLQNCAALLRDTGRDAEAEELEARARRIVSGTAGSSS